MKRDRTHADHQLWADLKGGIARCVLALGPVIADRELDGASSWAAIVTCFGMFGATIASMVAAGQAPIIALRRRHRGDRWTGS